MQQLFRFLAVGLGATGTHFLVVILSVESLRLDPLLANALAWAVALWVSYVGHYRWTFTATGAHLDRLPRYAVVSVTGLALNLGSIWALHSGLGLHYLAATALGVALSIAATFTLSRLWAFAN